MKKFLKILMILIFIFLAGYFIFNFFFNKPAYIADKQNDKNEEEVNMSLQGGVEEAQSDVVETTSGVIYTGKVIPVESRYYLKDGAKELKGTYVEAGQIIESGKILFDYYPDNSVDAQIIVIEKNFEKLKNDLDDYYSRIEEYKSWLAGCDPADTGYINYLKSEIKNTEGLIAQNKVEWINAEEKIRKLKDSKDDYSVKSEISGLVYAVNKDNTITPSNNVNAYVTVYSLEKKVRISVSEFEYKLLSEGQKVNVKIDGLNKEFESDIIKIDSLPNNLESSDTSYYNVDISINSDVPYGYTAVVTVKK